MLLIGFNLFSFAMSEAIKEGLVSVNQKAGDKKDRMSIFEPLIEFLEYHSRVKKLSKSIVMSAEWI